MVDRKRRRHSLYDDTIVSEEPPTSKTPRRTPEQTSAPLVIRTENSPARSLTSITRIAEGAWDAFKVAAMSLTGTKGRKGKSAQRHLSNGDACSEHDDLSNGDAPNVPMREVSQLENRPFTNDQLDDWQVISNAGPSTRSRTRSRSPNPSTPKVHPRQALMSASPPEREHLAIASSTLNSVSAPSTRDVPAEMRQPLSTLSTQPEPSQSTQSSSTLSSQPTSTLQSQPTATLSTDPSSSTSQPANSQDPPADSSQYHASSGNPPLEQVFETEAVEENGDLPDGTEDQPIELGDSDEEEEPVEAGPSRPIPQLPSSSRTPRRAPPSRPDLTGQSRQRSYGWMDLSPAGSSPALPATPPMTRSRAQTPKSTRQRRRTDTFRVSKTRDIIVRRVQSHINEAKAKGGDARGFLKAGGRFVKRLRLQGGGKHEPQGARHEDAFKRQSIMAPPGLDKEKRDKEIYSDLLRQSELRARIPSLPTVEQVTRPAPEPRFSPSSSRKIADQARLEQQHRLRTSIDDIRERFERQTLELERSVQARLYPKAPIKMSDARAKQVRAHLSNPAFRIEHGTAEVKAASLSRLKDGQWLDDEVINFYGSMIQARSDRIHGPKAQANGDAGKDMLNVHFFNSFFYKKLSETGYDAARLKRWSKKFDVFAKDIIIFPINIGNMHWTVGAINLREKRVEYYDSLSDYPGKGDVIFEELFGYLRAEHLDKKGSPFDDSGWSSQYSTKTPQQNNGSDCGVFSAQTLEALSRGKDLSSMDSFDFGAENMEYFRKLMVLEIAQAKLEPRWPKEA